MLTDGVFCVCVLLTLSGGEECRLRCALPQYEARPAGNEGARRVHPGEVKFVLICVGAGDGGFYTFGKRKTADRGQRWRLEKVLRVA